MGIYIRDEDVKIRLIGKVRFTDDIEESNKMHTLLLKRLIEEAEGDVEHDLSPRYMAPFQTEAGGPFKDLPQRPTREFIRTLCELKAVMRVLETDFGRGSVANGDKYAEKLKERYDEMLKKHLDKKEEPHQGWKYPPFPGMKLNYFNTEADDGYAGMVLVTGQGDGAFPKTQINDPSENWVNSTWDDLG